MIVHPQPREPLRSNGHILLAGTAFDDRHRELRAPALTWYADKPLGHGRQVIIRLPAGRYTVRLVARDRHGRAGITRRPVHVRRPPLRLLAISYPHTVARRARTMTIHISASEHSTLHTHRRYRVSRHTKRIVLPLPRHPRSGFLRIPCQLRTADGRHLRGTITIQRR